ncbi:MAG TPA: 3-phosphoshikimate 1-carboxyvinyltransferase [Kofleriaceae bacterium]|nr:3-phosphoshikimate 1-carboxyvinyltransferase [Kofleriaceae bacterium]
MTSFVVEPATVPLVGDVTVPGDKSIGHRALLFSLLSRTPVALRGLGGGADNGRTARAIVQLGAVLERDGDVLRVVGRGAGNLRAPKEPIDCGNSGTTIRLLTGLLAGQRFGATLFGDESLSKRPMRRVIDPLTAMGAHIAGTVREADVVPPLTITPAAGDGARRLRGVEHELAIASAQVKTALVLAGLYADGKTRIAEPGPSRDHSERLLAAMGAPIRTARNQVIVDTDGWDGELAIDAITVPGDPSSSAFLIAAALLVGAHQVGCRSVCVNPTRTGFLDALAAMGAHIELEPQAAAGGEPIADLWVRGAAPVLRPTTIAGDLTVRAIDEVPILAAVAARAHGTTIVADAGELRVKESDRIATTVSMLRGFGVEAEAQGDGLVVHGSPGAPLRAARVNSEGDHRIAMAAAVLALCADGPSQIDDVDNVATSFPTFVQVMRDLGATIRIEA